MIKIAVRNQSTVVKDLDVEACAQALQIQVSRDFAPAWGIDAEIISTATPGAPSIDISQDWQLIILDDSDQADALGYHELTAAGLPLGKVFAKSDIADGSDWRVTASHELLEMLVDPQINTVTELDNADGTITFYAKEVCDAVEADPLGYEVTLPTGELVPVSDFVTPTWFVAGGAGAVDFMHRIANPFQLAAGGYISVFRVPSSATGWTQITAQMVKTADVDKVVGNNRMTGSDFEFGLAPGGPAPRRGDRRWRRSLPDSQWRLSER